MIPRENIEEIIDLFNQYMWIICIPFVIYFGCSILQIGNMKKEIGEIQIAVDNHVSNRFDPLISTFEKYSFISNKSFGYSQSSVGLKNTISSLRWKGIEESPNWMNGVNEIVAYIDGLLIGFNVIYEDIRSTIKLENSLERIGEQHPELRGYMSLILAENIIHLFASSMMTSGCCFRSYYNPTVQKFGDVYYLYPDKVHRYGRTLEEFRVNGELVKGHNFTFRPKKRGMNILDIEYKFVGDRGIQVLSFRKGLMVE